MMAKKGFGAKLGQNGRRRVQRLFSFDAFASQLHNIVHALVPA
jgi:hypothetical protein